MAWSYTTTFQDGRTENTYNILTPPSVFIPDRLNGTPGVAKVVELNPVKTNLPVDTLRTLIPGAPLKSANASPTGGNMFLAPVETTYENKPAPSLLVWGLVLGGLWLMWRN